MTTYKSWSQFLTILNQKVNKHFKCSGSYNLGRDFLPQQGAHKGPRCIMSKVSVENKKSFSKSNKNKIFKSCPLHDSRRHERGSRAMVDNLWAPRCWWPVLLQPSWQIQQHLGNHGLITPLLGAGIISA